jgi:hypothetical protein
MKKVTIQLIMIVILVTLACPLPAYSTSHPLLVNIPWDIKADPVTMYVGAPVCDASFKLYVTGDYKDEPIRIYFELTKDKYGATYPGGFLFDPPLNDLLNGIKPDWQATVTALLSSPWEHVGDWPMTIWAFPARLSLMEGMAYNVSVTVHFVVQDTGVETCPPSGLTTVHTTMRTTQYTTYWTYTTSTHDWCDWWDWWRRDCWVGWWPWTTGEFDFSLDATPASQSMKAGESASFTTDVRLVSGIAQPVTLSLSGLPGGMSYSFSLPSANPRFTSALRVSSQSSVSPGTYPVTIVGTGGGKTHSVSVNLVVAENKQSSSLSLSVSPPSLKVGESVALGGALSPGLTTTVELVYTRPDGFELVKHVTTSNAGAFSDAFKPDMPGPWSVKARWPGDTDHYAGESQTQSFSVEPLPEQPPSLWDQIARTLPTVALLAVLLVVAVLAVILLRRRSARRLHGATVVKARFCTKCGTTIPEGSGYCPNCGERI